MKNLNELRETLEKIRILTYETSNVFLPSVLEGTNTDLFEQLLRFFAPPPKNVLDLNCGYAKFYQNIDKEEYKLTLCDIRNLPNVEIVLDCTKPLPFRDKSFHVVVLDPPYQHVGKNAWLKEGKGIFHQDYSKIPTQQYMMTLFNNDELCRVLKDNGILIIKIMDIIESSQPVWNHIKILSILPSFKLEDLIIYKYRAIQDPKWKKIYHARKCHAYFMVFIKKGQKWRRL